MEAPIQKKVHPLRPTEADDRAYIYHLVDCQAYGQMTAMTVEPYTIDKLSFFIKTESPTDTISTPDGCRTCREYIRVTEGCYGTNHTTSIQFPDGFLESFINESYKEIARKTALPENSVAYEVFVPQEKRIGHERKGTGLYKGVLIDFPHLYVDMPEKTSYVSNETTATACNHILATYAKHVEELLRKKTSSIMTMIGFFDSWKDEVAFAHAKFSGTLNKFKELSLAYHVNALSANEKRITVIKYCLGNKTGDEGTPFFHIEATYHLLKEFIGIFEIYATKNGYNEALIKRVFGARLNPLTRGLQTKEATVNQKSALEEKIGDVTVSTLPLWRLQDIVHFPLTNEGCTIDTTQTFTIRDLVERQLKFKVKAGSMELGLILNYDMDEKCQREGTKHLFIDPTMPNRFRRWALEPEQYYDVVAIIPLGQDLTKPSNFLFILPDARPASTTGWYNGYYLHHTLHNQYRTAFSQIKKPLCVLDEPQLAGIGTSLGDSKDSLTLSPQIKIGNLQITVTNSGYL